MDDFDENTPIKRKRGRPAKSKIPPVNAENTPAKVHPNSLANLTPGKKKRKHISKDVMAHLDELGFNPLTEMVKHHRQPDCPSKVRFDIEKELLSYYAVKPKHQLQSDSVNAFTELMAVIAGDGRPQPATAVTFDGEAQVIEHEGADDEEDAEED